MENGVTPLISRNIIYVQSIHFTHQKVTTAFSHLVIFIYNYKGKYILQH